ncbi:hypothetical protein [Halosegnis marinus]|uniref:hypothetical protein n=1 Tax=Halosegnis marinus TaxID=3034023 RepID=UPI003615FB84
MAFDLDCRVDNTINRVRISCYTPNELNTFTAIDPISISDEECPIDRNDEKISEGGRLSVYLFDKPSRPGWLRDLKREPAPEFLMLLAIRS